jgi:membrane-bound serine protease (ClpP class)
MMEDICTGTASMAIFRGYTGKMLHQTLAALLLSLSCAVALADKALVLTVDAAIGPATADYILDGINTADQENYGLVIVELDTPGGLDSAMRDIIKGMLDSDVPVAIYVAPNGSRAASAGTYMLYASHVAAMAPVSNLGAATPVQIGAAPGGPEEPADTPDADAEEQTDADDTAGKDAPEDAMTAKMVNDAVAYIKGLAQLRGRNEAWAESAVREAVSLTASEALEQNVIDLIAKDLGDLLEQAHGRVVEVAGEEVELATRDLEIERLEPNWRTRLLTIITDPNIAYLLMLAGVYGLLLEGYNPGALVPGIIGGICLLLALFAFQVLPVNYAGLALIVLGVMLMVAEGFVPSFGVLGMGGLASFIFGSIILMDADIPGFGIARSIIAAVATVGGMAMLGLIYLLMRARNRPVVSGVEALLNHEAVALEDFFGDGAILLDGERWHAVSDQPVKKGDRLKVTHVKGLIVNVEPE